MLEYGVNSGDGMRNSNFWSLVISIALSGQCCRLKSHMYPSLAGLHRDDEDVLEDEPMAPSKVLVEELEGSTVAA